MTTFDAVVIGAGPNGLAAAGRLAKAGRKVVVLERRDVVGGLSARREFHPGYAVPGLLHDEALTTRAVAKRLGLERHGFRFRRRPAVHVVAAHGAAFALDADPAKATASIAGIPGTGSRDAEAYERYRAFLARVSPALRAVLADAPPPLTPHGLGDLLDLARRGLVALRLSRRDVLELARVAPMCVADFLNEKFATPALVEALAAPAVADTWSGPWSAGTTTNLLILEGAGGEAIEGGPAALVAALEAAARKHGAEIRTGAPVARIRVGADGVEGVALASGETVDAKIVLSTVDPRTTMLRLVPPGTLAITIENEFRRIRMRGAVAKLHLALAGPLELAAFPGALPERVRVVGGHVDDLERAFDAVKYREIPARPHLEVLAPSVADPTLAPAGHHVVSIAASWVPLAPAGGWTTTARLGLADAILRQLEAHAPELRRRLVAHELLTPADLEQELALHGGQMHHGETALDQLLVLRPAPSAARYATSVPGLFLGGAGSHPGGGVRPAAGLLAAQRALAR